MNIDPIVIIGGEPKSVFLEIFLKAIKKLNKISNPIILISSKYLLKKNMKKFNKYIKFHELNKNFSNLSIKKINLIDIKYNNFSFSSKKITSKSNSYLTESFKKALQIIKKINCAGLINGPISKKTFLKGKFNGVTEYLASKTKSKNPVMLIYNEHLSVSPLTTHVPIKKVANFIKREKIINSVNKINNFYKFKLGKFPKIAVLGLNPHCETNDKISEEEKIIVPAINILKRKRIIIQGPFAADTFFLKENFAKYDIVIGMYHDQVLTPIKTLFGFDAINITAGLPFIRVSPDHGPNEKMVSKGISNPLSLMKSINFFEKINDKKT